MDEKEQLTAAYVRMYYAMIKKDECALKELLTEDFVLLHMTGMRQGKKAFIEALLNGTLNYYSAEHENVTAETSGTTAAVCGKSRVNAAVFGGGRYTWRLRLDLQLIKHSGEWKISRIAASTY